MALTYKQLKRVANGDNEAYVNMLLNDFPRLKSDPYALKKLAETIQGAAQFQHQKWKEARIWYAICLILAPFAGYGASSFIADFKRAIKESKQ